MIIKDLIITCTVVSIFSMIIMNIIGEDNPQKEIIKIGLGCVMIISLITKVKGSDLSEIINIYDDFSGMTNISLEKSEEYQANYISQNLEKYVFESLGIECKIYFNSSYEMTKVILYDECLEIYELLGIDKEIVEIRERG